MNYSFIIELCFDLGGVTGGNGDVCARLIEWILGPQRQELVRKTGYIPINKAAKQPENPSE